MTANFGTFFGLYCPRLGAAPFESRRKLIYVGPEMLITLRHSIQIFCASALSIVVLGSTALGCPLVNGLVDFNCDQQHRVAILGDSIVRGVGDTVEGKPGYPGRLTNLLGGVSVVDNLGTPGITSDRLLATLKSNFSRRTPGSLETKLRAADIIIIAVGVNDYFTAGQTTAMTTNTLIRIHSYLKSELEKRVGFAPSIAFATPTPTKRVFQRSFINLLRDRLIGLRRIGALPVDLRFDRISLLGISGDGLHPRASGYDAMSLIAEQFVRNRAQLLSAARRKDLDADGVYDYFELRKFGTNARLADTDGDTLLDGNELFTLLSNPLDAASPGV